MAYNDRVIPKELQGNCYGCKDRHPGCHDIQTCEKWAEYQQRVNNYWDNIRSQKRKIHDIDSYCICKTARIKNALRNESKK